MTSYYCTTKNNETLDYICWRHYVCNNLIGPAPYSFDDPMLSIFLNHYDPKESGINGIIEKVLDCNPDLSNYIHLPLGQQVILPDITEIPIDVSLKDLWN